MAEKPTGKKSGGSKTHGKGGLVKVSVHKSANTGKSGVRIQAVKVKQK